MSGFLGKRYWIIGASEGLGRAVARKLSQQGAEVVVSARSEDRLNELVEELPGMARAQVVDVRDHKSLTKAAEEIGDIDGMIYLAGAYWPMRPDEIDIEKLETMCDVNFTGAMRAVAAVLPRMIERDHGHIVLTGSLSGFRGLPRALGYGASKSGVMHLAESLRADLRGRNIKVQLVNPGFIRTRLTDKNDFHMPMMMEPHEAAQEVVEHMWTDGFQRSFPTSFSLLFRGSRLLPDWIYYSLFR